ncbi:hypothetical protein LZ32DRAFT_691178 [Colletotrichum eremochloae]|nr:hypothetical protein LZ32DRAFT_691178 [Colletotrichum eremochloae]
MSQSRVALVFGATGITGWSTLREAVNYPTTTTFSRIIGLTTRLVDQSTLFLPDDKRISLFSGVDLTKSVDEVGKQLAKIDGIEQVTDIYFAGEKIIFSEPGVKG